MLLFLLALCVVVVALFVYYCRSKLNYWNDRGVPNWSPSTPLGDLLRCVTQQKSAYQCVNDFYADFKSRGCDYAGFYFTVGPVFVPIDPVLAKRILTTDNDHFQGRGSPEDRTNYPLLENAFTADASKWRYLREMIVSSLTPAKVRTMFNIIETYSQTLVSVLDENKSKPVDVFNYAQRFILDSITSSFFGIHEDTLQTDKSPLIDFARGFNTGSLKDVFRVAMKEGVTNPGNFALSLISGKNVLTFVQDYSSLLYESRKGLNSKRNDVLDYLVTKLEDQNEAMDWVQFKAQILLYIVGSFETSSFATSYAAYEIAKSKDIQDKLRAEINDGVAKNGGKLDFDLITNLDYLNRIVKEILRFHPIFPFLFRSCTEEYTIPGSNLKLEKGVSVAVPISAIHKDPEIFPNPHVFDPDRFLLDQDNSIYMPFGFGQRICPGQRLGLTMVKTAIVQMVRNFEISVNEKTGPKLETAVFTKHTLWKYKNKILLDFKRIE